MLHYASYGFICQIEIRRLFYIHIYPKRVYWGYVKTQLHFPELTLFGNLFTKFVYQFRKFLGPLNQCYDYVISEKLTIYWFYKQIFNSIDYILNTGKSATLNSKALFD